MRINKLQAVIGMIVSLFLSVVIVNNVSADALDDSFYRSHCYSEDMRAEDDNNGDPTIIVITYACSNYADLRICVKANESYYLVRTNDECKESNAVVSNPKTNGWFQGEDIFHCRTAYSPEGGIDATSIAGLYYVGYIDCNYYGGYGSELYYEIPENEYSEGKPPRNDDEEWATTFFDPNSKNVSWMWDNCEELPTWELLHPDFLEVVQDAVFFDCLTAKDGDKGVDYRNIVCLAITWENGDEKIECNTYTTDLVKSTLVDDPEVIKPPIDFSGLDMACEDRSSMGWFLCDGSNIVTEFVDYVTAEALLPLLQWRLILPN